MMNDDRLLDAFDDCLNRLKAGESLASCLRAYPELEADLRPMLEAAQAALKTSRVPRPAQMRSRAQFLTAAAQKKPQPALAGWWRGLSTVLALAATALIVWLGFSVVTNTVVTASTPTFTATPTVLVSPTNNATEAAPVEPTATSKVTTPAPTASPTHTPLPPTATRTASPTRLPATSTSEPTQSVTPTLDQTPSPRVTDDDDGSGTPEPDDDHEDSGAPEPGDDHSGTETPEASGGSGEDDGEDD